MTSVNKRSRLHLGESHPVVVSSKGRPLDATLSMSSFSSDEVQTVEVCLTTVIVPPGTAADLGTSFLFIIVIVPVWSAEVLPKLIFQRVTYRHTYTV